MVLRDFEQDYSVRRTPYLASRVWGGLHDGRGAVRLETEIVDDLSDVRNGRALHSLPRFSASATRLRARPGRDWRVGFDASTELAWLTAFPDAWNGELRHDDPYEDVGRDGLGRSHPAYPGLDSDHTEGSSRFETGEPVRRTFRGALSARLGATWTPGGWLWLRPWAEASGVLYGGFRIHDNPGALGRLRGGAELGTALFRDFGGGVAGGGLRHVIEPKLRYRMQPVVEQSVHPILTYDDVQSRYHRLEFELVNRLQRRASDGFLTSQPRIQALEVRLSTALELVRDARYDPDQPVEPLRAELSLRHRHGRLGARTVLAWERTPFQVAGVQGSLDHPNGNRLNVAYDWVRGGRELLWSAGEWYRLLHGSVPATGIHELAFGVTWVPYSFLREAVADPRRILRGFAVGAMWRVNLRADAAAGTRLLNHEYWLTFTSPCACWRGGLDLRFASDWKSPSFGVRLDLITR